MISFSKGHKDFFNYLRLKNYLENILEREVGIVLKDAIKPGLKEKNIARGKICLKKKGTIFFF